MHRLWCSSLLFPFVLLSLCCGGGQSRELQSISISKTIVGTRIQFVATGTFSASPMTVTPLPVDWSNGLLAPPPPQYTYSLSTQPYVIDCGNASPGSMAQVSAFAPTDPNAPMSGTTKTVVSGSASFTCP
ncbi:MAG TPA: hypothetical protein VMP68_20530 [Candidatus Eisenbacteria bacterium]|nr:hypothetical protein [Candidatus Eisenbacteria bacterium]